MSSEFLKFLTMAKTVIVAKGAVTGIRRMFETIEEASQELGMSGTSVSTACIDGRETKGWLLRRVDRVYALHLRAHNEWVLGVSNARNDAYLELDNPSRKIGLREIDQVRDITVGWYWQEGR